MKRKSLFILGLFVVTSFVLIGCPLPQQERADQNRGESEIFYSSNSEGFPVCSHILERNRELWNHVLGAVEIGLGESLRIDTPEEDEFLKKCGCPNITVEVGNHYEPQEPLQLPRDLQTTVEAVEYQCNGGGCPHPNMETARDEIEIGTIVTQIQNHRNFHKRVGGAPPNTPGVIRVPLGDNAVFFGENEDLYYVPGCAGAEAAGQQAGGVGERGYITRDRVCEVNVRKVVHLDELRADAIYLEAGRCLETQGLSPELDIDVLTEPGITADENLDDRERRASNFATNSRLTDPWPEVTECIRQATAWFYEEPLRQEYARRGYDYDHPDLDGDNICDLQDTCIDLPNREDYPDSDAYETSPDPVDEDLVGDSCDNCPNISNGDQMDSDSDGFGDACELCTNREIFHENESQIGDDDQDGVGNACDFCFHDPHNDCDGDLLCDQNGEDPFPYDTENRSDGDSWEPCTLRADGEPVCSGAGVQRWMCDNCPDEANQDQTDQDQDNIGDICDPDRDGDGQANGVDNCPDKNNPDQEDRDQDGLGDLCDDTPNDRDGDGIEDEEDNCPEESNPDQSDLDNDDIGDTCDECPELKEDVTDSDHDCVDDTEDNCPEEPNPDQADVDGDDVGNLCDRPQPPLPEETPPPTEAPITLSFTEESPRYLNREQFFDGTSLERRLVEIAQLRVQGNLQQLERLSYTLSYNGQIIKEGSVIPYASGFANIHWDGLNNNGNYAFSGDYTLALEGRQRGNPDPILASKIITIYSVKFLKILSRLDGNGNSIPQGNADSFYSRLFSLFVNNDNDDSRNGNYLKDLVQEGPVPYENDLLGIEISLSRNLDGLNSRVQLQLINNSQNNGQANIRIWDSPQKRNPINLEQTVELEPPITLYVEGIQAPPTMQNPILLRALASFDDAQGTQHTSPVNDDLTFNLIQVDVVKDAGNNATAPCDPEHPDPAHTLGERIDAFTPPLEFVNIADWNNAYAENGTIYMPTNNYTCDFIDRDSERFYVRVISHNETEAPNQILPASRNRVQIGTINDQDQSAFDNLHPISLVETGESGIFVSKSQMLTTYNLTYTHDPELEEDFITCNLSYRCNDDNFNVFDGFQGNIVDDGPDDRTHQASIDSSLQVIYQADPLDALPPLSLVLPVCQRAPLDTRRELHLRAYVFKEPFVDSGILKRNTSGEFVLFGQGDQQFTFLDRDGNQRCGCPDDFFPNGVCDEEEEECEPFYNIYDDLPQDIATFDTEPDLKQEGLRGPIFPEFAVRKMVDRASRLWQQACISVFLDEVNFVDAPKIEGEDLFAIPRLITERETNVIVQEYQDGFTNILDLFIFPWSGEDFGGISYTPHPENPQAPELTKIFVSINGYNGGLLAHEIAHALDSHYVHDPDDTCKEGVDPNCPLRRNAYFYPFGHGFDSRYLNNERRIPRWVIERARRRRHQGNFEEEGNRLLCLYNPDRENNRECVPPPED